LTRFVSRWSQGFHMVTGNGNGRMPETWGEPAAVERRQMPTAMS